jgi:prevent-host-death family protein
VKTTGYWEEPVIVELRRVRIMRIENLREVKTRLSKIVKESPSEKSVVITKNGRPYAVLFPVTENGSPKHVE